MNVLKKIISHLSIKWVVTVLVFIVIILFVVHIKPVKQTVIPKGKIDTLNTKIGKLQSSNDSLENIIKGYNEKRDILNNEKGKIEIKYEKAISHIDSTSVTDDTKWLDAKLDSIQRLY